MTETNGAKPKRALSYRQARTCEGAIHPDCACRCHGAAHGAKRIDGQHGSERAAFETLPDEDPHHVLSAAEVADRRLRQRRESRERAREASHQAELKRLAEWNEGARSMLVATA